MIQESREMVNPKKFKFGTQYKAIKRKQKERTKEKEKGNASHMREMAKW